MNVMLPSANRHLTPGEFDKCCCLIDYYAAEGGAVTSYCLERGRDPALYGRGNVWEGAFIDAILKMLLSKKYNNINRLRLIGWHFSAYRVFDLAFAREPMAQGFINDFFYYRVAELPDDLDRHIAAIDPERRIARLAPRLRRILKSVDRRFVHGQPMRFGEIAGEFAGMMVNGDSVRYWSTMAVLYRTGILDRLERRIAERGFCRVMEIGPGYGGLAYQLKQTFGGRLQFIAVDLPESLIFSSIYLTTLSADDYLLYRDEKTIDPHHGLIFVPAFRSPEFFAAVSEVDLCVNAISMSEMTAAQVDYYGRSIAGSLSDEGMFFEVNHEQDAVGPHVDCKSRLAPHFEERLSVANTEVANDGDLDIWARRLPDSVRAACAEHYPVRALDPVKAAARRRAGSATKWLLRKLPPATARHLEGRLRRLMGS